MKKDVVYVTPPKDGKALFFKMPSTTNSGLAYDIRVMPDGEIRCSCKAYAIAGWPCKHIKAFLAIYNPTYCKLTKNMTDEECLDYESDKDLKDIMDPGKDIVNWDPEFDMKPNVEL